MVKELLSSKKVVYVLMTFLVFIWGMEFIAAKAALETIEPLTLICIKYIISVVLLIIAKTIVDRRFPLKVKDIPILLVCALFGDVIYFGSEYAAMDYLPVSVITIILAFVPCVSIIIEAIRYRRKPAGVIIVGVLASVIGVGMVIGADFSEFLNGKYIGYFFAFAAVICWNIYNFMTKDLSERYNSVDLTILQQVGAILLVLPYTIFHLPELDTITTPVLSGVLYLGIACAFIGFLIYINAIDVIGPTPCALFSNFLPVTSTLLGWVLLHEHITILQMVGGVVVIASGAIVIWKKDQEDEG